MNFMNVGCMVIWLVVYFAASEARRSCPAPAVSFIKRHQEACRNACEKQLSYFRAPSVQVCQEYICATPKKTCVSTDILQCETDLASFWTTLGEMVDDFNIFDMIGMSDDAVDGDIKKNRCEHLIDMCECASRLVDDVNSTVVHNVVMACTVLAIVQNLDDNGVAAFVDALNLRTTEERHQFAKAFDRRILTNPTPCRPSLCERNSVPVVTEVAVESCVQACRQNVNYLARSSETECIKNLCQRSAYPDDCIHTMVSTCGNALGKMYGQTPSRKLESQCKLLSDACTCSLSVAPSKKEHVYASMACTTLKSVNRGASLTWKDRVSASEVASGLSSQPVSCDVTKLHSEISKLNGHPNLVGCSDDGVALSPSMMNSCYSACENGINFYNITDYRSCSSLFCELKTGICLDTVVDHCQSNFNAYHAVLKDKVIRGGSKRRPRTYEIPSGKTVEGRNRCEYLTEMCKCSVRMRAAPFSDEYRMTIMACLLLGAVSPGNSKAWSRHVDSLKLDDSLNQREFIKRFDAMIDTTANPCKPPEPPRELSPRPTTTLAPQPSPSLAPQPTQTLSSQPTPTLAPQLSQTITSQPPQTLAPQDPQALAPQPPSTQQPVQDTSNKKNKEDTIPVTNGTIVAEYLHMNLDCTATIQGKPPFVDANLVCKTPNHTTNSEIILKTSNQIVMQVQKEKSVPSTIKATPQAPPSPVLNASSENVIVTTRRKQPPKMSDGGPPPAMNGEGPHPEITDGGPPPSAIIAGPPPSKKMEEEQPSMIGNRYPGEVIGMMAGRPPLGMIHGGPPGGPPGMLPGGAPGMLPGGAPQRPPLDMLTGGPPVMPPPGMLPGVAPQRPPLDMLTGGPPVMPPPGMLPGGALQRPPPGMTGGPPVMPPPGMLPGGPPSGMMTGLPPPAMMSGGPQPRPPGLPFPSDPITTRSIGVSPGSPKSPPASSPIMKPCDDPNKILFTPQLMRVCTAECDNSRTMLPFTSPLSCKQQLCSVPFGMCVGSTLIGKCQTAAADYPKRLVKTVSMDNGDMIVQYFTPPLMSMCQLMSEACRCSQATPPDGPHYAQYAPACISMLTVFMPDVKGLAVASGFVSNPRAVLDSINKYVQSHSTPASCGLPPPVTPPPTPPPPTESACGPDSITFDQTRMVVCEQVCDENALPIKFKTGDDCKKLVCSVPVGTCVSVKNDDCIEQGGELTPKLLKEIGLNFPAPDWTKPICPKLTEFCKCSDKLKPSSEEYVFSNMFCGVLSIFQNVEVSALVDILQLRNIMNLLKMKNDLEKFAQNIPERLC